MKMMKKIAAVFTLALAAAAAAPAQAGDIYEIVPLGLQGTAEAGQPLYGDNWKGLTPETALQAGQSFEFIVRLVSRSALAPTPTNSWDIVYAGHGSDIYAEAMFPLQLGLLVSGRLVGAEIYKIDSKAGAGGSKAFTDLYCRYTVKPGDLALPALLAHADSGTKFFLINGDRWEVRDEYGNIAEFSYCDETTRTKAAGKRPVGTYANILQTHNLADLNYHIKTIDFDAKEDVAGSWWRVVNQGATTTTNAPTVELTGAVVVTNAVELFVWAEDETAVKMVGAEGGTLERMTIRPSLSATADEPRDVFRFWTVPGKTTYPLAFEGVTEGSSTRLYLSTTTNFVTDAAGTYQTNFLTRAVYCTKPLPPSVKVTLADNVTAGTAVTALSGNLEEMAQDKALALKVRLTSPLASGRAALQLKVSLADDPSVDVFKENYLALAQSPTASYDLRAETNLVFTAGGATEKMVYVWPLGGDVKTIDGGILIEPAFAAGTTADVKAYDTANGGFRLKIKDIPPEIVSPAADGTVSVAKATAFQFPVEVRDSYRDLHAPQTYKVELRGEITGSYFATNGVAFRLGSATTLTTGEDELFAKENATVTVTDAQGNIAERKFALVVPEEKWVKAAFAEGTSIPEGPQNLSLAYTLSTASGRDLYAFLRPLNEAASNGVETAAYETGIMIPQGAVSNAEVRAFNFFDGAAGAGTELKFGIVLRTGETTNDTVVATYEERPLVIRVGNVAPTVKSATVDERPIADGSLRSAPVPMGVSVPLELELGDVASGDFSATNKGEILRVAWKQTDVDASVTDLQSEIDFGFPAGNGWVQGEAAVTTNAAGGLKLVFKDALFFSYEYTTQMVAIVVQDKDMRARGEWGPRYTFRVPVTDQPRVLIRHTQSDGTVVDMAKETLTFPEENFRAGRSAKFTVGLSEKPAGASDAAPVTVALSVVRDGDGEIALDKTNLTFTVRNQTADVSFTLLDGGELSDFQIVAEVLNTTSNRAGIAWSDYYAKNTAYFTVANLDPVVQSLGGGVKPDAAATNNVPLGSPIDITVTASDIAADLVRAALDKDAKAFRVEWIGPGGVGGRTTNITYNTTSTGLTNSLTAAFVYTPQKEGFSEVEVNVYDGDGGFVTTKVLFFIEPTKRIRVLPIGPVNRVSSQSKYASQPGLGKGRVWAKASRYDIDAFAHTYYSEVREPQLTVYAFGYPAATNAAGYADDGTLADCYGATGKNYALSQSGSSLVESLAAGNYRYGVTGRAMNDEWRYDNFFYCWFEAGSSGEESEPAISEQMNGKMRPSTRAAGGVSIDVKYDAYEAEKESYGVKRVEAIFARELYPEDNMGDINADGIPDLYVLKYGLGVYDVESGEMAGNDLANLSVANEDNDALPSTDTSIYAAFIPGLRDSWLDGDGESAAGRKFTALTEIRGFHHGLNNAPQLAGIADVVCEVSTNSFSELELDAARIAGALLPDGNPDIEKWSPERPTDPTLEDTDGDGLPDGYEYYIWYQAHVGYMENGVHKFMKGRKYVPTNPGEPEPISSELIAATYDPLTPHPDFARQTSDIDNDGIPDYLEFEIGTNPFDFDTDGDGLPDGYELVMTAAGLSDSVEAAESGLVLDPLKYATDGVICDADLNADNDQGDLSLPATKRGDAMASETVEMSLVCVSGANGGVEWFCAPKATPFEPVADGAVTGAVFTATVGGEKGTYVTTVPLDSAQEWLARDLGKDVAWKAAKVETGYRLGEPVELPRGTAIGVVTNEAACETLTLTTVPEMFYRAWKYGVDNGFARGAERQHSVANPLKGRVVYSVRNEEIELIHFQIYQEFGFEPRTGWKYQIVAEDVLDTLNTVKQKTRNYTHYDEFLSMAFFYYEETLTAEELQPTVQRPLPVIWQRYSTNPMRADTDADGMPDGWELYLMAGPKKYILPPDPKAGDRLIDYGPRKLFSPLWNFADIADGKQRDADDDGLEWPAEYSGVESAAEYAESTATIVCVEPKWRNKKWPTDPWKEDTDGDGIVDGEEFSKPKVKWLADSKTYNQSPFVYGESGTAGGGLNPLSWDTDKDGLPDPWEAEFYGTFNIFKQATTNEVEKLLGSAADRLWKAAGIVWNRDGMDGTVPDALEDYDGDGLANWQEYLVGAMRCWRYDDTISTWGNHSFDLEEAQKDWDNYWYKTLVDEQGEAYNPHLVDGMFDIGAYFSRGTNSWDTYCFNRYYMFRDGVYHQLKHPPAKYIGPFGEMYNAWTFKAASAQWDAASEIPFIFERNYILVTDKPPSSAVYPVKYICCHPMKADTDNDGMDDYYELFHGLNPLLGMSGIDQNHDNAPYDVIYNAYGGDDPALTEGTVYWSAENNYWLNANTIHRTGVRFKNDGALSTDDFVAFPWLAGRANADPDGDNIRNQQEAIMPNVQAASTYLHTDPTPLWMTDRSYDLSLTRRYYRAGKTALTDVIAGNGGTFTGPDGTVYRFTDFPGFAYEPMFDLLFHGYELESNWDVAEWLWSFEENEGYDSDHDYLSDFEEGQGKMQAASDPQQAESPYRRQAMWFNGTDAFLQTALPVAELPCTSYLAAEPRQNFLYYTVECWAKADAATLSQTAPQTLVERAVVSESSNAGDERLLRKNFQIGLRNGRWYTRFDSAGTDQNQAVELDSATAATADWTHLAASYDGTALKLYVNGVCVQKATSLQPEHGMAAIKVNGAGELDRGSLKYDAVSILVGASAATENGVVFDNAYRGETPTTLADYSGFFKGYIDEVRIWDGARLDEEIRDDYTGRIRYTAKMAEENRREVYTEWLAGARRSPVSTATLPAELKYHWTFDNLPSAVNPEDVIKTPAGFSTSEYMIDAKAVWSRPEGWTNAWWRSVGVRSSVYTDTAWVPWIADTVGHLPRLDLTTVGSVYWSANFAGYFAATNFGYTSFMFPHTGEVFSKWVQQTYKDYTLNIIGPGATTSYNIYTPMTRYDALTAAGDPQLIEAYRFTLRDRDREGFDLLPMGGAFPRRISMAEGGMWDDATASDAWSQTGSDVDNNGLPDWWEELARQNYCTELAPDVPLTRDTIVTYHGVQMPAWEAYLRELAAGTIYNAGAVEQENPAYRDLRDTDKDGLPDWWETLFGFDTVSANDANADPDGDGLSNYQEYLIGEVYAQLGALSGKVRQFPILNPTLAYSTAGQVVPDAFLRHGSLYLGEMFADHDRIEDEWEDKQSEIDIGGTRIANVSRFVYDTEKDPDEQGLSNWSRARVAQNGLNIERLHVGTRTNIVTKLFDLYEDERVPKFEELRRTYGTNRVSLVYGGLIYRPDGSMVRGAVSGPLKDTWDPVRGDKYTFGFEVAETEEIYEERLIRPVVAIDAAVTYNGLQPLPAGGILVVKAWNEAQGVARAADAVWTFPVDAARVTHYQPIQLRKPDRGFLKEGKTTFVVYCATVESGADKASKGEANTAAAPAFTPGQPYGALSGINVGHLTGESFSIELTDVSPVMMRIDLAKAVALQKVYYEEHLADKDLTWWSNVFSLEVNDIQQEYYAALRAFQSSLAACVDRAAFPVPSADLWNLSYVGTNFALSASNALPVRIVQGTINGVPDGRVGSYYKVLLDTTLPLGERTVLTEADVLSRGELDFGWNSLVPSYIAAGAANPLALTNATFSVVFGVPVYQGDVHVHENVIAVAVRNHYEYGRYQTPVTGKGLLTHAGQPTFCWTHTNKIGKVYPAFRLRVWADKEKSSLVYDSGALRAPRRDAAGRYSWTAPLWPGMMTPQGVVFSADTTYYWTVSMLDAKFTAPAGNEAADAFAMQAATPGGGADDYGVLPVAVKYMGPGRVATDASAGCIRVEAFTAADFGGKPVGASFVREAAALSSATSVVCNAEIQGLERDGRTYYVRAYLDADGDGVWSPWESWGYAAYVDVSPLMRQKLGVTAYEPRAFEASNAPLIPGQAPACVVYIDDCDTNGNMLPDVWEWNVDGVLGGPSADLTGSLSPYIVNLERSVAVTTNIYAAVTETSPLLYGTMMLRAAVAARPAGSPAEALVLGGLNVADIETIPEVAISAFSLEDGRISVDLAANGTVGGAPVTDVPASISVRLTLTLQYTSTLGTAWRDAGVGTAVVTLGAAKKTVTSDVLTATSGKSLTEVLGETVEANPSGCYFRIKVKIGAE